MMNDSLNLYSPNGVLAVWKASGVDRWTYVFAAHDGTVLQGPALQFFDTSFEAIQHAEKHRPPIPQAHRVEGIEDHEY
jgi:hypothetical protein